MNLKRGKCIQGIDKMNQGKIVKIAPHITKKTTKNALKLLKHSQTFQMSLSYIFDP